MLSSGQSEKIRRERIIKYLSIKISMRTDQDLEDVRIRLEKQTDEELHRALKREITNGA